MAAKGKGLDDAMKAVRKLHTYMMHHKDAGPFLEPVDYKAWNLPDYPLVVKHPMDLGTVQSNLDNKYYPTPKEYADHVRLVWRNCMTYNKEGSDYHQLAEKLGKHFEEKFKKIKWTPAHDMPTRMPTLADRRQFSQAMYSVGSATLGVVVDKLDARCPKCIRKVNGDDVEINIDAIDPTTFWELSELLRSKRKAPSAVAGAGAGAGADKKKKNKRQRRA